jgi:hypothetical protein
MLCLPQAGAGDTQSPNDSKQLVDAFLLSSSSQSQYAKDLDERTFYVQLHVTNLRPDLKDTKCVDTSFISWVRKFFSKSAKTITIVTTITGPDGSPQKIPLFQISKDEQSKPPQCLTDVLTSEPITGLYVAVRGGNFHLDVQALTQQNVTITAASTTVAAASDLLSFTGGSAWLLKNVATSQAALGQAISKVDASLSNNWSSTSQQVFHFDLNPWPADGDWEHHLDEAEFAVGSLVASAGGVTVDTNILPSVRLDLQYTTSVFGGGLGHYDNEDEILATHLTFKDSNALGDIFKLGVSGFTTDQALAISDPTAMTAFCNSMRANFPNFLTTDDALAARHAVLLRRTVFYNSTKLRSALGCESPDEVARLKLLSSSFQFPDELARLTNDNRTAFVKNRGGVLITPALLSGTKDKLSAILSDPNKFTLLVSSDIAASVFPSPETGKTWGGVSGGPALDELVSAGPFRTGCWAALPNQNLRNLVGMALNKKTGNSSAILVEFDTDYPGPGADPVKDTGKVTKLTFLSVDTVQSIANLPNWPESTCPLN